MPCIRSGALITIIHSFPRLRGTVCNVGVVIVTFVRNVPSVCILKHARHPSPLHSAPLGNISIEKFRAMAHFRHGSYSHQAIVFHLLMSALKATAPSNMDCMSVTWAHVPGADVLVKAELLLKQSSHVCHHRHVPARHVDLTPGSAVGGICRARAAFQPEDSTARQFPTAVFRAALSANGAAELHAVHVTASTRNSVTAGLVTVDVPRRAREQGDLDGAIILSAENPR